MSVESRASYAFGDLAKPLSDAVWELSAGEQKQRPWIVVMDTVTKKFVQFASIETQPSFGQCPILVDIPDQKFDKFVEELLVQLEFEKHAIDCDVGHSWNLAISPEEIEKTVAIAIAVMKFLDSKDDHLIELERGITDTDERGDPR